MNPISVRDRWVLAVAGVTWVALYDYLYLFRTLANADLSSIWAANLMLVVLLEPGCVAIFLGWKTRRGSVGWLVGTMYCTTGLVSAIVYEWSHPNFSRMRQEVVYDGMLMIVVTILAGVMGWLGAWRGRRRI